MLNLPFSYFRFAIARHAKRRRDPWAAWPSRDVMLRFPGQNENQTEGWARSILSPSPVRTDAYSNAYHIFNEKFDSLLVKQIFDSG